MKIKLLKRIRKNFYINPSNDPLINFEVFSKNFSIHTEIFTLQNWGIFICNYSRKLGISFFEANRISDKYELKLLKIKNKNLYLKTISSIPNIPPPQP